MQAFAWLQQKLENRLYKVSAEDDSQALTARAVMILVASTFLTKTADTLSNPKITLTALLQSQGASVLAISLLVPLRESGALLPQVWLANFTNRYRRLGPVYSLGTLIQGVAAIGMMLSAWLLNGDRAGWALIVCLGVLSVARALCSISYKAVLGKMVPGGFRGKTTGWASSAAGFATVVISLALLIMPERESANLLIVFLGLAAVSWWLATALFSRLDEHEHNNDDETSSTMAKRWALLRDQPSFRKFVIVRSLLVSTALVAPWYVMLSVSGNEALGSVGALLLASGLASFVSSPFWGYYSDRSSRWVLQASAICVSVLGALTVAVHQTTPEAFDSLWLVPVLYFLLEISHQGVRVGRKTYLVDIASDGNRVDYVAISNTLIGIIILCMGIISGIVATWLSPIGMIILLSLISAAGAALAYSLPEALENT
ncbi:MAG: MFS transporter [Granulosicoccus sp.]